MAEAVNSATKSVTQIVQRIEEMLRQVHLQTSNSEEVAEVSDELKAMSDKIIESVMKFKA